MAAQPSGKNSIVFECPECGKQYTESEAASAGSFCNSSSCSDSMVLLYSVEVPEEPEEEVVEEVIEAEETVEVVAAVEPETAEATEEAPAASEDSEEATIEEVVTSKPAPPPPPKKPDPIEVGLGILLCDTSASMEDYAIEGQRVSKMKIVSGSVARGIWDLVDYMADYGKKRAYIAICGFNKKADILLDPNGKSFIKSVEDIGNEFSSARELSEFIFEAMRRHQEYVPGNKVKEVLLGKENTKNFTNLNKALSLAHDLTQACMKGDLTDFGGPDNIRAVEDVCLTPDGDSVTVPNIRCLLYSDGFHNYPRHSKVTNPFADDETSILMTAFLGKKETRGHREMESISGICPKHGMPGSFLIEDAEGYQQLRGLFRMSSGASGFCVHCLPKDI